MKASAWITEMIMMMMIMFLLITLVYSIDILYGYTIKLLSPLPVEISRVSLIVQINVGFLEKVTSDLTFLV